MILADWPAVTVKGGHVDTHDPVHSMDPLCSVEQLVERMAVGPVSTLPSEPAVVDARATDPDADVEEEPPPLVVVVELDEGDEEQAAAMIAKAITRAASPSGRRPDPVRSVARSFTIDLALDVEFCLSMSFSDSSWLSKSVAITPVITARRVEHVHAKSLRPVRVGYEGSTMSGGVRRLFRPRRAARGLRTPLARGRDQGSRLLWGPSDRRDVPPDEGEVRE